MKKTIFTGVGTAIITPMNADGIDYEAFGRLIDWQIEEGVDAIIVCGTTGECSTLTDEEHKECIDFCVNRVNKRIPVIAGTGSNDVAYAIQLTKEACESGADGVLIVTPYYNKATQKGLIEMYTKIADASSVPVIIYNVPSRTGVSIAPSTYLALADHPNISGIKEANGDISKIVETMSLVGDKLDLYSGNDDQVVPIMSVGGKGVISVLSNVCPRLTKELTTKFFAGDIKGSAEIQFKVHNLVNALFCEVNPIPVKAAMSYLGYGENYLRLPLTPMEEDHRLNMIKLMNDLGVTK